MKIGLTSRWIFTQRLLIVLQALSGLLLAVTGIAGKTDVTKCKPWLVDTVAFFQEYAIPILIISSLVMWAAQLVKYYFGDVVLWGLVKSLLEELRSDVFATNENAIANRDRVTLFRFRSFRLCWCCWPVFDWLCAVERTGHIRSPRRWFRARDGSRVEGIAAKAYVENGIVLADNLPLIERETPTQVKQLYADKTFLPLKWIEKKAGRLPLSLCGIPVEVKGQVWGVIVIDSISPTLGKREKIQKFYEKNAKIFSKILEKL